MIIDGFVKLNRYRQISYSMHVKVYDSSENDNISTDYVILQRVRITTQVRHGLHFAGHSLCRVWRSLQSTKDAIK